MKAINIKWDTDGDAKLLEYLPKEMEIPDSLAKTVRNSGGDLEKISDYLSNATGFCHFDFKLIND